MLIDSNIDFVCCDNPHATKLTVHILGATGEHERDMIGKRTAVKRLQRPSSAVLFWATPMSAG